MRIAWGPEDVNGTGLSISGARKAEWVAENRDNPLRNWDTRGHISKARYNKAVTQYKQTRRAALQLLEPDRGALDEEVLRRLGREYALAFNRLDGSGSPFIETVEREDLFNALARMVEEAGLSAEDAEVALAALVTGVDDERAW
jgi:hypothetical protein